MPGGGATVLDGVGAFFLGTLVQCLPALVALVAWGEAGHRILRQFGGRLLWELSGLVVVGVAALLYGTLRVTTDDTANVVAILAASTGAVLAVTVVTTRVERLSSGVRALLTGGAGLLTLQCALAVAVAVSPA